MIIRLILFLALFSALGAQGQIVQDRASAGITVRDYRWMGGYNAFLPRYTDTTAANLQKGIDTSGAIIYTYDVRGIWIRQHSPKMWLQISGISGLGAIGSSPNANGASISGSTLNLQPASASFGGVVTTGAQTFAGAKTFSADGVFSNNLSVGTSSPFSGLTASKSLWVGSTSGATSDGNIISGTGYASLGKVSATSYGAVGSGFYLDNSGTLRRVTGDPVALIHFNGGAFQFQTSAAGSANSAITLSTLWTLNSSGHWLAGTDNTYDIGAAGANRVRNYYGAGNATLGGSLELGAAQYVHWTGRTHLAAPVDGVLSVSNNAQTDFSRLVLGPGTSSSFPALKRAGTTIIVRKGDDSDFGSFEAGASTWSGHSRPAANNAYELGSDAARWSAVYANTIDAQAYKAPVNTISINATLSTQYTVLGDATGANITITLPDAATYNNRIFIVKKKDASANTVTVQASGSDTIDGAATKVISTQYSGYTFQSAGSDGWVIIGAF